MLQKNVNTKVVRCRRNYILKIEDQSILAYLSITFKNSMMRTDLSIKLHINYQYTTINTGKYVNQSNVHQSGGSLGMSYRNAQEL